MAIQGAISAKVALNNNKRAQTEYTTQRIAEAAERLALVGQEGAAKSLASMVGMTMETLIKVNPSAFTEAGLKERFGKMQDAAKASGDADRVARSERYTFEEWSARQLASRDGKLAERSFLSAVFTEQELHAKCQSLLKSIKSKAQAENRAYSKEEKESIGILYGLEKSDFSAITGEKATVRA